MQLSVAAVVMLCPISSNVVKAQAVHVAFVATSIGLQWLHTDLFQHIAARRSDIAGRILFAALLATPGPVVLLNAAFVASTVVRDLEVDVYFGASEYPQNGAVLAIVCAVLSYRFMQSEARSIVAAMDSSSSEAAVHDLLGILCDAVVTLDERLVLSCPSPKLDALLMRLAPTNGSEDELFPSLFREEDQGRVEACLSACDGVAQSVQANMLDVVGTPLRVQLYQKRFEDVFGRTRHVVGIVEDSDYALPASADALSARLSSGSACRHQRVDVAAVHRGRGGIRRSESSRSTSSRSSSDSGSSADLSVDLIPFHVSDQEHLLEMKIDTTSPNLEILSCTVAMTSVLRSVEGGQGLLDLIPRRDRNTVLRWVQNGGGTPTQVTLIHASSPQVVHRSACFVGDNRDARATLVVFSNIRTRVRGSASRSAARRAAGGSDSMGTGRQVVRRLHL